MSQKVNALWSDRLRGRVIAAARFQADKVNFVHVWFQSIRVFKRTPEGSAAHVQRGHDQSTTARPAPKQTTLQLLAVSTRISIDAKF